MVADMIKWHWGLPASKISNQDYQNKDRLSVCRLLILQQKPKLGCTKPSTGATCGPQVGHSWSRILVL